RSLPSGGASLAIFARSDGGGTLVVEQSRLTESLTPAEVEALPDIEVERLKQQQPKAKDFVGKILEGKGGRGSMVQYSRVGLGGKLERVLVYSLPVGRDLYRLVGIVPDAQLAKYEGVVRHMIVSFKPGSAPPATR